MLIISQNQDTAIDSKDILFLFIQKTLDTQKPFNSSNPITVYKILAMVRGQQINLPYGAIELFRNEDMETTKKKLCFLAEKIFNESSMKL